MDQIGGFCECVRNCLSQSRGSSSQMFYGIGRANFSKILRNRQTELVGWWELVGTPGPQGARTENGCPIRVCSGSPSKIRLRKRKCVCIGCYRSKLPMDFRVLHRLQVAMNRRL